MEYSLYHQPYSHQTRFKVVHSKTKLIKTYKAKALNYKSISQFKLVQNHAKQQQPLVNVSSKPTFIRNKSIDKSSTALAKTIGNKYKWIRTGSKKPVMNSFKVDRRKTLTTCLNSGRITKQKSRSSLSKCLVHIRGVKFQTHPNGKSIQRLVSNSDNSKSQLTSTTIKKVEDPKITRANILLQRSIQISNGRYRLRNSKKKITKLTKKKNCIYFNRFGKCHRGDKCPFIHDRSRIAVCTQFLNGRCQNSNCPYSHDLMPEKVPTCSYFIKGACGQDNCPYAHSYVGHDAQLCEDFVQGFCVKGTECSKKHVLLCPEFESNGQCPHGKQCHLTHRRKRNENTSLKIKPNTSLPYSKIYDLSTVVSNFMPAYIPLSQENEERSRKAELKLKPSFLE